MQFQQRLVGLQEHMMSFAIKLTANRDDKTHHVFL